MKKIFEFFFKPKQTLVYPELSLTSFWCKDFWYSYYGGHYYRFITYGDKTYVVVIKGDSDWTMWVVSAEKTNYIIHQQKIRSCLGHYTKEIERIQDTVDDKLLNIMNKLYKNGTI